MNILITGSNGMVGSSFVRTLKTQHPDWNFLTPTRQKLDLSQQGAVANYFKTKSPIDLVIHAASRVGGIKANSDDLAGFLSDNLKISLNVIDAAHQNNVPRLINLGSSCMYPRDFGRPLIEEDILAAPLEPTNEGYALAKISAYKLCAYLSKQYNRTYKTFIPCNLYGPNDRYDMEQGHVLASVILKITNAIKNGQSNVEIWGTGTVRREFVYVDDLTDFIIRQIPHLEQLPDALNIGAGEDITINDLYKTAAKALGYTGTFTHNTEKPDGMTRKLMNCSKALTYGWKLQTQLADGIRIAAQSLN